MVQLQKAQPQTEQIVASLKKLKRGWDDHHSPAISAKAIAKLRSIVGETEKCKMLLPRIDPLAGGGVSLKWRCDTKELLLELAPDGRVGFFTALVIVKGEETFEKSTHGIVGQAKTVDSLLAWYFAPANED